MRNFAVKFAILSAGLMRDEHRNVRDFLDLCPMEALAQYKDMLSEAERGVLMFGFSDEAILAILDEDFEVEMASHTLVFRKPFLDARSIQLAGTGRIPEGQKAFSQKELTLIDNLAIWLLDATRDLYRPDLSPQRLHDIKQEYAASFKAYAKKTVPEYEPDGVELLLRSLFASAKSMQAFCHSLTVDALYKADAARVIFGEQSGYYQAWFRKQIFRHMMSKAVAQYISSCVV